MNKIAITTNYEVLHFDEYPILFIGCNAQSEIIIGSFLFEDEDEDTLKYFHSIVAASVAVAFLKGNISYLEVLKKAWSCAIVTKDYNENILNYKIKPFSSLEKSWLPLPTAFCPTVEKRIIDTFEIFVKSSFVVVKKGYYLSFLILQADSNFTKNRFKKIPMDPIERGLEMNSFLLFPELTHKNRVYA